MLDAKLLKEWQAGYEAVAEIERAELQRMTIEERWQKLNLLLRSAVLMGWFPKMQERNQLEAEEVRVRWNKLKAAYQ